MIAQVFDIVFTYDKLKATWADCLPNPERRMNQGFLQLSECDTMGMCNIGVI